MRLTQATKGLRDSQLVFEPGAPDQTNDCVRVRMLSASLLHAHMREDLSRQCKVTALMNRF
jgi:hypothetical protein